MNHVLPLVRLFSFLSLTLSKREGIFIKLKIINLLEFILIVTPLRLFFAICLILPFFFSPEIPAFTGIVTLNLKIPAFAGIDYLFPVLPKPPSPRTVSESASTVNHSARSCLAMTNCAIRSPLTISKSSLDKLTKITPISPL